jgi:hypothetical protein
MAQTKDTREKMAVIGTGPIGLCVAKALLEHNVPYEQLEADDDVGGNWYRGIYDSAHIISSKKTTQYSDFPMPADYPDFPSRQQMLDYLRNYTERFKLRPHIQFKAKVERATPTTEGRWVVELVGGESRVYNGLIICNGHHREPRTVGWAGTFTGISLHSKDYKRSPRRGEKPLDYTGKRVLVIGAGNSACDIAVETARVAARCCLSLKEGIWFLPNTMLGVPLVELQFPWLPVPFQRWMLRALLRIVIGRHEQYGLPKPKHRLFDKHPTINSEVLLYLKRGRIHPKEAVERFDGQRVKFVDNTSEEFDIVVRATGFEHTFPFLPQELRNELLPRDAKGKLLHNGVLPLYGNLCLEKHKNLFIVGWEQPRYGFGPLITRGAELIARLVALQHEMDLPIGLVMNELGMRPATSHLIDPYAMLRDINHMLRMVPRLAAKGRQMRRA